MFRRHDCGGRDPPAMRIQRGSVRQKRVGNCSGGSPTILGSEQCPLVLFLDPPCCCDTGGAINDARGADDRKASDQTLGHPNWDGHVGEPSERFAQLLRHLSATVSLLNFACRRYSNCVRIASGEPSVQHLQLLAQRS